MASYSLQVLPGLEQQLGNDATAVITVSTNAPTTATAVEVRIDLVNATGGAGWTVSKLQSAFDNIIRFLIDPENQTSVPQSLEV